MNPDVKVKWIAALRSGDYKQTHGALRDENGYCCLGVLCDVAAKEGKGKWHNSSSDPFTPEWTFWPKGGGFSFSFLPAEIGRWAGFGDDELTDPRIGEQRAVTYNDSEAHKLPFTGIADLVEKNL